MTEQAGKVQIRGGEGKKKIHDKILRKINKSYSRARKGEGGGPRKNNYPEKRGGGRGVGTPQEKGASFAW